MYVVKLHIDSSVPLRGEWQAMLTAASFHKIENNTHKFAWTSEDWSKLSWQDTQDLDEWIDEQDANELETYQFVQLVLDDNYMVNRGSMKYGIRVGFLEE